MGTYRIYVLKLVASCENSVKGIFCVHNSYVTFCYRSNPCNSRSFHEINDRNQSVDNETRVGNCYVKANGLKNLFVTGMSLYSTTLYVIVGVLNGRVENA